MTQGSRMIVTVVLAVAALWSSCEGYKTFQDMIPNGAHVSNPCRPRHMWNGVGHKNWEGGGATNAFGADFQKNGFRWDKCVCELDSDGDGRTNGKELGDPLCRWSPGQPPDRILNITHPGICEPYNDPKCKEINDFDVCQQDEFYCDAIKDSDVQRMDLRLPLWNVPKEIDPMLCVSFDLPPGDNHIIAWEPIIDNPYVLHFIQVFGCEFGEDYSLPKPTACNRVVTQCKRLVLQWTIGQLGRCYPNNQGIRIGQNGLNRVFLQVGWENPLGLHGQADSSGIRLYYTPALRTYDLGMMMIGQFRLDIPPGRKEYTVKGVCGSKCTERFADKMYIVEAYIMMLYNGIWAQISIFRDGEEVAIPVKHAEYNVHQPINYKFPDPVEVLQGDELVVTCAYNTQRQKTVLHWDWTSLGEMCVGWLTFFPKEAFVRSCLAMGESRKGCDAYPMPSPGDCDVYNYLSYDFDAHLALLKSSCDKFYCSYSCRVAVDKVRNSKSECFDDDVLPIVFYSIRAQKGKDGKEFSDYMHSCVSNIYGPPDDVVEKPKISTNNTKCFWKSPGTASQPKTCLLLASVGVLLGGLLGSI